jgi:hypothetical protein
MRLTPSQKTPDNQQSKEQGTGTSASPMCRGCEQGAGMDFSCRGRGCASLLLLAVLPVPEFPWSSPVPGPCSGDAAEPRPAQGNPRTIKANNLHQTRDVESESETERFSSDRTCATRPRPAAGAGRSKGAWNCRPVWFGFVKV